MALMKASQVPEDAVAMDEVEATTYVWDVVGNWESAADTWALRYGPAILGGINAMSGVLINKHYRDKLKLGNYGYLSSVIPISLMPALMTSLFHRHTISTNMLLMKNESCPICYEVRSGALQIGLGIAYPMILGPLSGLMFANRYSTYRVPSLGEGPKVMFAFLKKITRPLSGTLVFLSTMQLIASSLVTYFELRNNFQIRRKMIEIENTILAEHGYEK